MALECNRNNGYIFGNVSIVVVNDDYSTVVGKIDNNVEYLYS